MLLNNKAISLAELLVSVAIATALGAGLMVSLSVAQNSFLYADTQSQIQQSLGQSLDKVAQDLYHATFIDVNDGGGINGSDILKFTRVSLCVSEDCHDQDWTYVVYKIDPDNRLARQILDSTDSVVRENYIAPYISNFNVSQPEVSEEDNQILSLTIELESQKRIKGDAKNAHNPLLTDTMNRRVAFRNVFYQE